MVLGVRFSPSAPGSRLRLTSDGQVGGQVIHFVHNKI